MTYKEKLELYSQGKLDEQQRTEIEKELEKQEAFTDYLFEHQTPPGMEDFSDGMMPFDEAGTGNTGPDAEDDSEEIAKQINRSIKKAFIKTGVIAAAAAVVITLFVVFALPHIVSAFYYDPGKSIGTDENGNKIDQFERDMSVYAEMFMPEMGPRISTGVESYGYGNYSYYIDARFGVGSGSDYEKSTRVYTGSMKRNSVECYNYEELETFCKQEDYFSYEPEEARKSLAQMNGSDLYYAYVTFDREMPYEKFYADYVDNDRYGTNGSWVWCGARVSDEEGKDDTGYYDTGFYATTYQDFACYPYDNAEYPELARKDKSREMDTEQKAATHFGSMIRYLSDNEKFGSLRNHLDVERDLWSIDAFGEYISENGIDVYGFVYVGGKEQIENLSRAKGIKQVTVRPLD